jgi:hypothetical protein
LEVLTPKNRYSKLKNDEGLDLKQSPSQTYDLHMKKCKREGWRFRKLQPSMGNVLSSKTLPKQPQTHVERRREEKNERDGELTVLLLKDPLCAMLPTKNQSPTCAMAPKVQGLMREERRAREKGEKWWKFLLLSGGNRE